ncbi:flavanone 3-dioxygenase 2 [Cajanus cajan]|uniref:Flavonol synthase/flavanone 3-hydroxylase n=1 Tax=Cajanus cajan TaxID=3821 RepID=A0A151R0U2_CAJCA|nr:flavanone 3-dioxygenase 2 [Cajanus cajan]KYP36119.1 Flavonol synthase/flavanone 3-hydroxylase [Cajanus cajan]
MEAKKPFQFANNTVLCLSPDFILPEEKRPCLSEVSHTNLVPIIDLKGYGEDQKSLVQNVSDACKKLGIFQVMNHGVPKDLCESVMVALLEFFQLPHEERAIYFTRDFTKQVKIFNYSYKGDDQMKVTMWSETFTHPWHPTQDFTHHLPTKPLQYRDVFTAYAREIGCLMNRLFSLMSKGLGLEENSIVRKLGERPNHYSQANYYPPCPEPELTMGLNEHNDITALTILQQLDGVSGLQVKYDENWVAVDPVPGALVIILADQMQVLSNGRYKSPVHRAVTNGWLPRLSLALFHAPNDETLIGPIEELTDEDHPPIYRNYRYKEFMKEFYRQEGKRRRVKETFKL